MEERCKVAMHLNNILPCWPSDRRTIIGTGCAILGVRGALLRGTGTNEDDSVPAQALQARPRPAAANIHFHER